MARKNLIEISAPNPARVEAVAPRDNRPIAGFVPQERSAAPVGGITKTLGNITEKMERASETGSSPPARPSSNSTPA